MNQPDKPADGRATSPKYLSCPKCGKRFLAELGEGVSTLRCPVCRERFEAVLVAGQLRVLGGG